MDADDARLERQGQAQLFGMLIIQLRVAQRESAVAHGVELVLRIAPHADAVEHVQHGRCNAGFPQLTVYLPEPLGLKAVMLGRTPLQMAEQAVIDEIGHPQHRLDGLRRLCRAKAQAVQPGIHLAMHMHLHALPNRFFRQRPGGFEAENGGSDAVAHRNGNFGGHGFAHDQDVRIIRQRTAKLERFLHAGDGKQPFSVGVKNFRGAHRAHAIGVGFQHGNMADARASSDRAA